MDNEEKINDYILFWRDDPWDAVGRYAKYTLSEKDFQGIITQMGRKPTAILVKEKDKMYFI